MQSKSFYGLYGSNPIVYGIIPADITKIQLWTDYVILQCITVFCGIATVFSCVFVPEYGLFELDVLARIMYLYDTDSCHGAQLSIKQINSLVLSNNTQGLAVRPIKNEPVVLKVLSKLSGKTKRYLTNSIVIHVAWMLSALILRLGVKVKDMDILKIFLRVFYFTTLFVNCFDICMGVVYISHIQQSLTKAMIIRYSGWGMAPGVESTQDFGGWVPILASACWMRGVVFFIINFYCSRVIRRLIRKIKKREVRSRLSGTFNVPFPYTDNQKPHNKSLLFRAGENTPYFT